MNDLETADINSKWRRLTRKRSFVNLNSIKIGIQTRWPNIIGTYLTYVQNEKFVKMSV